MPPPVALTCTTLSMVDGLSRVKFWSALWDCATLPSISMSPHHDTALLTQTTQTQHQILNQYHHPAPAQSVGPQRCTGLPVHQTEILGLSLRPGGFSAVSAQSTSTPAVPSPRLITHAAAGGLEVAPPHPCRDSRREERVAPDLPRGTDARVDMRVAPACSYVTCQCRVPCPITQRIITQSTEHPRSSHTSTPSSSLHHDCLLFHWKTLVDFDLCLCLAVVYAVLRPSATLLVTHTDRS